MSFSARPLAAAVRFPEAALFLMVAVVRLAYLAWTGLTYEDSLITLRYAENLAEGRGLVYNPGERVFGASTPFYVLLLSLLAALPIPEPLLAAKVLAALADGVTAVLWCRLLARATGAPWAGSLFAVAFGLSPLFVQNSIAGMETSFALLFLSLAFAADQADRPAGLGAALGLLVLTRPDGLLAAAVLLGVRAVRERGIPWRAAGVLLLTVLPWLLFAAVYYGSVVPNSVLAKAAAYNRHAEGIERNLLYTLHSFAPYPFRSGTLAQRLFNAGIAVLLVAGIFHVARSHRRLAAVPLLWAAWWAYLVLPRTLLFLWYYPLLVLPAYVLAGLGLDRLAQAVGRRAPGSGWRSGRVLVTAGACLWLGVAALVWMRSHGEKYRRIQRAETLVRREIGRWLAVHTPPGARVAVEPIGYIGYYSGRRILDEVGLVSPEMIPFTRAGAGWFGRAIRHFRPEYVVERPYYLRRNRTINSGVPMFAGDEDRDWFHANYVPVTAFPAPGVALRLPEALERDYRFVIYRRADLPGS